MITTNSTLTDQVVIYANWISTKEADNDTQHKSMRNLQREAKNLKAKLANMKKSSYSGGTGNVVKDKG